MTNEELIKRLRKAEADAEYKGADLYADAADAIERLTAEVDRKDNPIERMRDLMRHYKAAYRTAYKLYQEARNEQQP